MLNAITFIKRSYLLAIFQLFMAFALFLPTLTENNDVFTVYAVLLGFCYGNVSLLDACDMCIVITYTVAVNDYQVSLFKARRVCLSLTV